MAAITRIAFRWVSTPIAFVFLIGTALVVLELLLEDAVEDSLIVVTASDIARLEAQWQSVSGATPDEIELENLIQGFVEEEMFVREARRLGLEQGDVILRRRLAQKYRFVMEDATRELGAPETLLQEHFDDHPEQYVVPERVSFRHVFFAETRHAEPCTVAAQTRPLLSDETWRNFGDSSLLTPAYNGVGYGVVQRDLGSRFASAVRNGGQGVWFGPIQSTYGCHLVFVADRSPARIPAYSEVKEQVRLNYEASIRENAWMQHLESLHEKYTVTIAP